MPQLDLGNGLGGRGFKTSSCILKLMQLLNINIRRFFELLLTRKNIMRSTSAGHSENGLLWSKGRGFFSLEMSAVKSNRHCCEGICLYM